MCLITTFACIHFVITFFPQVCTFGRRVTSGCGHFSLFNRKLDTLRSSLVSLSGREHDFNDVINVPDASIRRYCMYNTCITHV